MVQLFPVSFWSSVLSRDILCFHFLPLSVSSPVSYRVIPDLYFVFWFLLCCFLPFCCNIFGFIALEFKSLCYLPACVLVFESSLFNCDTFCTVKSRNKKNNKRKWHAVLQTLPPLEASQSRRLQLLFHGDSAGRIKSLLQPTHYIPMH